MIILKLINFGHIKIEVNKKINILLKENVEIYNKGKIFELQLNANKIIGLNQALFLINKEEKIKI